MSKRKAEKPAQSRKRTFVLANDVMIKLAVEAERRGVSKSALASTVLAEAFRHVVVSDRSRQSGETESAA